MRGVRDRFTDGSQPRRTRGSARRNPVLLAAVVAVGVVAGASMLTPQRSGTAGPAAPAADGSARTPAPRTDPTSGASGSLPQQLVAPPPASDDETPDEADEASTGPRDTPSSTPRASPTGSPASAPTPPSSTTVAERFVDAWVTTDPARRAAGLEQWATPALARALTQTDPNGIPATTRDRSRDPTTIGSSSYLGSYAVDLSDGTTVLVDVVADGAGGWLASRISPPGS